MTGLLIYAWRKVKLRAFILLILPVAHAAPPPVPYGPYVIEKAVLWVPHYLDVAAFFINDPKQKVLIKEIHTVAEEFVRLAYKVRWTSKGDSNDLRTLLLTPQGKIQFRPANDPIFQLRPNEPARMAVTGDEITDPVIFNLGLISDPRQFSYGDAIALWIHEHGHKVKNKIPAVTQQEIDELGAQVKAWFEFLGKIYDVGSQSLWVLNPVPPGLEGSLSLHPYSIWPIRISPTVAAITADGIVDLTPELEAGLDRFERSTYFEAKRTILHLLPIKSGVEGETLLRMQFRTTRHPKNDKRYLQTDLGPNHFTSAKVRFDSNALSFEILSYQSEPAPAPLASDASAEILEVQQSAGGKITGIIRMETENTSHFLATTFPAGYLHFLTLINGEPRLIEARVEWKIKDSSLGKMPGEKYKQKTVELGRFEFVEKIAQGELELDGVVARFLTYGGYNENEQFRVQLKEAKSIQLNCETILK